VWPCSILLFSSQAAVRGAIIQEYSLVGSSMLAAIAAPLGR
jgi:hypothetical protein